MGGRRDPLEETLGRRFTRPDLLRQALTHSSAARSRQSRGDSNERLEFLGDRVLGLVAARLVFERFPDEDEGALARRHAALVRREALARVAERIGLGDHLVMSRGEAEAGGRNNPGLLADACEAVIAALYLDGGLEAAHQFIRRHWEPLMEEESSPPQDAKTALQEWAQAHGLALPAYAETGREGPPHAPVFTVQVSLDGLGSVTASGPSKRAAQQGAAEAMLEKATAGADEAGE